MGKYKERTITCLKCGKIHTERMPKNQKYCSLDCYRKSKKPNRKTGKTIKCTNCGKLIYKSKCYVEKHKNLFCGVFCHNEYQSRNKIVTQCKICGKDFKLSKSLYDNRKRKYDVKYCSLECRNNDDEWIQNACVKGNLLQQNKKGLNKLELLGRTLLEKENIVFEEQVLVANKFLVDVFIKDYKLVIQWDGEYWHGHPSKLKNGIPDRRQQKRMGLDKSQDAYMKKCGFIVLRFWEKDVIKEVKTGNGNIKETIRQFTKKSKSLF